ncbi:aldehyde-activating protein [Novosphingobium sp. Gsoil 351]|nr:aldehyde-activating protein [Novosphingobium sp. Gsoil 351]
MTLSIAGDAIGARTCWCRDCQKFGGGNGTTNAFFRVDDIAHTGALNWYESIADSGNTTHRAFCPKCGSHVFTKGSGAPHLSGVRVSILDDSDLFAPQAVIWTSSAPRWAAPDARLPNFPKAPPPPPAKD